ncbi:MAG: SDR family oxidoreductase [Candidatus Parabeggiatoa sp.]|nr:SDR family oxidoreductase [Candidatus Parabeggiatoa sp.]
MTNPNKPLNGRTAIVTGSGQNIGKAIALLFAANGANVVVNGHRNQEALNAVVEEARQLGGQAMAVMADVSVPAAVHSMVDKTVKAFGKVDITVSNVSIRPKQAFLDISVEDWQNVLNTNLNAAFYLAHAVVPHMMVQKWGRLIQISGDDAFCGENKRVHNITAKLGLHGLTRGLAYELGCHGITANTVAPGVTDTTRITENYPDLEQWYQHFSETLPVRRIGRVAEIAEACLYLAKETSGFVTGQVIHVNGGSYMG